MQKTVFKEVRQKLCTLAGLLIGFSLFINLLVLAIPLYMLQVYNRVISSYSTDTLLLLTIIVLAALFTMSIIDIARAQMSKSFGFWMDAKLSVFMLKLSIAYWKELHLSGSSRYSNHKKLFEQPSPLSFVRRSLDTAVYFVRLSTPSFAWAHCVAWFCRSV